VTPTGPDQAPIVEVKGLKKTFKDFWGRPKTVALDGLDLTLNTGEVCALIGPNGSGKSTLIKILLGLLFPTSGSAAVFGNRCFDTVNKNRIGFLPEENCFYPHLSAMECLDFFAGLLRLPKKERRERIHQLLETVGLSAHARRPMGDYSLGMTRRVGMAQALLTDPELLILDEPTNGLDPLGTEDVHQLISDLRNKGKTILISTHLLSESESICDRACLLNHGKCLAQGQLRDLHASHGTSGLKELFLKLVSQQITSSAESIPPRRESPTEV
jgi:ABC-2 type transport system ATP-binding protein